MIMMIRFMTSFVLITRWLSVKATRKVHKCVFNCLLHLPGFEMCINKLAAGGKMGPLMGVGDRLIELSLSLFLPLFYKRQNDEDDDDFVDVDEND